MSTHNPYLTQRLIDTCLREDVFQIVSLGRQPSLLPEALQAFHPFSSDCSVWLEMGTEGQRVYLPVVATHYMQDWCYQGSGWLLVKDASVIYQTRYQDWMACLQHAQDEESQTLSEQYLEELECAEQHLELCQQAFAQQKERITRPIKTLANWAERALQADQIASYLDHPYYPSARAKFGFQAQDMQTYAPEFAPSFHLNWLAIERSLVSRTSAAPSCWPSFEEVGLADHLSNTHVLFPCHPMTFTALNELPQGVVKAPLSYLEVSPTLSVRTVSVNQAPEIHIKVPLMMRTLGSKNIRLIKPSTIYDGHWFEQLLTQLHDDDSDLQGLYRHCNEQHGAHLGDNALFTYIVRQYPSESLQQTTLVPVAALASPMPDQRLFLEHLADQFYQGDALAWFSEYVNLLNRIHLTLWLKYGIALESNQQNAVVAFNAKGPLTMLMKDNDAARIWPERFLNSGAQLPQSFEQVLDRRILVEDELALGQMYTTITLQLDIAAIIEAMAAAQLASCASLYAQVSQSIRDVLSDLSAQGCDTRLAEQLLFEESHLYTKSLLSSGSLLSKQASGAADINKFYGRSAPNFLREDAFPLASIQPSTSSSVVEQACPPID
ncbi:IucA / IucC family protein [Marinomonas aquimarina]|uniref:IucA / IucC family protein n=1 Tax=Marinomonas aquimarina TaxID=295068 RepID=A0A1A8TF60_9GAMM|nr:IucA/IucC family protein [Marinomonas aquimarina]SBS30775.1 IucA / IucC family protein [Marinomonas aquimarina]